MTWSTPRTWVAGEKPPASTFNSHVRDQFKAIGDAWTAFTPTTANITLGNGTLTGALMSAGKLTHFRMKLTLGSTSVITGSPTFTFGVTATATRTVEANVLMYDSSAGSAGYFGGFAFNSTTTVLLLRTDASAALSSTVPFTWTTSDELLITGTCEAT